MFKKLAAVGLIVGLSSFIPVQAEDVSDNPWSDAAGAGDQSHTARKTDSRPEYQHDNQGRQTIGEFGFAQETKSQFLPSIKNLQTSQGGPLIIAGVNTGIAPSNMAYMTEHRSPIGGKLPKCTLDSFVHQARKSGMADLIYGDEGRNGPPPYSFFMTIQSGGVKATTGHPSDAPSAWGTPLKYNSAGGVIRGM